MRKQKESEEATVRSSSSYQIGQLIKQHRKSKGWTQEKLAEKAGVTKHTILRLEKGRSWHSSTFDKVCRALNVTLTELTQPYKLKEGEDYLRTLGSFREVGASLEMRMMPFGKAYELPCLPEGTLNVLLLEIEPHKETKWREHEGEEYVFALTLAGVHLGGESSGTDILLREGETLTFWGTELHKYYNPAEEAAFVLVLWNESDFDFDKYPELDK